MTKDLETGNTLIDSEHRQLFDMVNKLQDACSQGKGRAQIESSVKFLMDYVKNISETRITSRRSINIPDMMHTTGSTRAIWRR